MLGSQRPRMASSKRQTPEETQQRMRRKQSRKEGGRKEAGEEGKAEEEEEDHLCQEASKPIVGRRSNSAAHANNHGKNVAQLICSSILFPPLTIIQ